ncbi:hypothetical protein MPSEU_000659900 [Mayamaea pseudoterrestris]|nr:hypothetical protein MPSEU_000659900 [Mayamaea pseudoterrestris]
MPKRRRSKPHQEPQQHEEVWQPVDVTLERNGETALDANHYDDDQSRQLKSHSDLEAPSTEDMGIFFGLQVIQPDQYQVTTKADGTKRFMIVGRGDDRNGEHADQGSANAGETRQQKKKDTTKSNGTETDVIKANDKQVEHVDGESRKKRQKKEKQKRKESIDAAEAPLPDDAATSSCSDTASPTEEEIQAMQQSWLIATGGVSLHPDLCKGLLRQQFFAPLPIQAATLPASVLGRRNIVGAAPTGSGKTLSFLIPVLQCLLEQQDEAAAATKHVDLDEPKLQALILTPTRELAMQIHQECDKLLPRQIGTIVGGLALAKQARVLNKFRPPIIVATPGRLWELITSRDYPHLNDLSQIRFLVIDEADRMMKQGSFPQLKSILESVQTANPMDDDDEEDIDDLDDDEDALGDRLLGLPGIRGEAQVEMLTDDILAQIEEQRTGHKPVTEEVDDEDIEFGDDESDENVDDDISLPLAPPVHRLTFVYSATLTLPASEKYVKSTKKSKRQSGVEGAIAEILDKAHAKGKTKVVDLSSGKKVNSTQVKVTETDSKSRQRKEKEAPPQTRQFQLPPGLTLQQIKCTQKHKDSHLYAYLTTTADGAAGPCLVFCNSIAGVRRLGATLQTLGMDVRILHAKMQQRARMKAVESLKQSKRRVVVIATDVAARGLDIPSVATVVHYDASRTVDTFVHRAGRTARGVGVGSTGCSVSLIASGEDKNHARIFHALQAKFEPVHLDGRLLTAAQERVNLASKVVLDDELEQRRTRSNQWYKEQADAVGFDVEDDMYEDADDKDQRQQGRSREAKASKAKLKALLSQPMVAQRYGKFLSTSQAVTSMRVAPLNK